MRVRLVCLPILVIKGAPVAHVVSEELGQVLGFAVRYGPFVVLGVPRRSFGFLILLFWCFLLLFLFFFSFALLRRLDFGFLDDNLLLHVGRDSKCCILFFTLETDDAHNLTNSLLNGEELVHESELQALLVGLKLVGVAEAFEEDEALAGAALSNLLLNELHDQGLIVVNG